SEERRATANRHGLDGRGDRAMAVALLEGVGYREHAPAAKQRPMPEESIPVGSGTSFPTIADGNPNMIRNRPARRTVALALVVLGGLLMVLAPPIWIGAIPLAVGVLLEVVGITLEHGGGG